MEPFKGLGEMHLGQLLKTTPDPEARVLLRVRVEDLQDAETEFPTFMGDVVEPRRDFIVTNASQVERAAEDDVVGERIR